MGWGSILGVFGKDGGFPALGGGWEKHISNAAIGRQGLENHAPHPANSSSMSLTTCFRGVGLWNVGKERLVHEKNPKIALHGKPKIRNKKSDFA